MRLVNMKEYLVCEVAYSYGVYLKKARRFTEEEKKGYAEWFREKGFLGVGNDIKLEYIKQSDVNRILKNRQDDGSFNGCTNCAYIITQAEWNVLLELNEKKRIEDENKETENRINKYKQIIEQCKNQEKLYTKEEAERKRTAYNNAYNEGGEGYVPHFYTVEEYEYAKSKLNELLKK